jgi:hypothetical protein
MLVSRPAQPQKEAPVLRHEGAPTSAISLTITIFIVVVASPAILS